MYKVIYCKEYVRYNDGLNMQQSARKKVLDGEYDGILFILEHAPVYTLGTGGGRENFLISEEELSEKGIDIVETKRGGNVTFHGPGQVVAYPIFNLKKLKQDAHWYIDCLEEVVIKTLEEYGIAGSRKSEYRGVWIDGLKISALGVHLKRWVTFHGLSFNVNVDKAYFNMINPCGITQYGISSLEDYTDSVEINKVKRQLVQNFEKVFHIKLETIDISILE
ncbi:MAG: lipoyl(octanoyl) transferase LipB [Clostridia bacterium]|nr:lipoyl(octanoyl) transferase LipB [Clostridia bacterium]